MGAYAAIDEIQRRAKKYDIIFKFFLNSKQTELSKL